MIYLLDTDTLKQPTDYNEAAQLSLDAGSPGEAQKFLERGFAAPREPVRVHKWAKIGILLRYAII